MTLMQNADLFSPLKLRQVTFRNRIGVSPMCQYSSEDGFINDWHLVHLGSRAVGGAGLVMLEASAVEPRGRISPQDLGIWKDEHIEGLGRVATIIRSHGAVPGIQIAHAGRKASTRTPWQGGTQIPSHDGGWRTVAPSSIPFRDKEETPVELTPSEIDGVIQCFNDAAHRAALAGFDVIEIHAAHGYLIHQFLSPLSNRRSDEFGGSFENRIRFLLRITHAVRKVWPSEKPLFVRISATDWAEGGWDLDQSVELARRLAPLGVDLVDCSSGGLVPYARIPLEPGYQVPFAAAIRDDAHVPTAAVGLITEAAQANSIVESGQADMVLLARAMLRDPYWPIHAAQELGQTVPSPIQYHRAFPAPSK